MNIDKWAVIRAKGKARFVMQHGVLYWGISTALMWSVIMHLIEPTEPLWVRPAVALVLFPLGGIFFGHFVWRSSEAKFNRLTK
ncbi:hypothetical protein FLM48_15290 [Shewanella sp. Scap07]|uniref:hypothetical protein n=1 Tax=Shewanella sp. Scap07 TaxID=2589987 RepID=UPI0015BA4962|nr:hypothetical protein [Shewanella sp. Scap07]QLE86316.1 hypothetical protein FLM48_15290 [Shewanella sp. Scap07]